MIDNLIFIGIIGLLGAFAGYLWAKNAPPIFYECPEGGERMIRKYHWAYPGLPWMGGEAEYTCHHCGKHYQVKE